MNGLVGHSTPCSATPLWEAMLVDKRFAMRSPRLILPSDCAPCLVPIRVYPCSSVVKILNFKSFFASAPGVRLLPERTVKRILSR